MRGCRCGPVCAGPGAGEYEVASYGQVVQQIREELTGTTTRCDEGPPTAEDQAEWRRMSQPRALAKLPMAELVRRSNDELEGEVHSRLLDELYTIGFGSMSRPEQNVLLVNALLAEVNNGGDLVEQVIRTVDPLVAYTAVHASRGKVTRAEPVAALYEQGRVHHVGTFAELEDQQCSFAPQGLRNSPDHVDALCWAITELMLNDVERKVLETIDTEPTAVDQLVSETGLPVPRVLATLSVLETRRLIRRLSGTTVVRV